MSTLATLPDSKDLIGLKHDLAFQEGLQSISQLQRFRACGRAPSGGGTGVSLGVKASGKHYFSGLQTCGSVWACPTCSSNTRSERINELADLIGRARQAGYEVLMGTYTLKHAQKDSLDHVRQGLHKGYRATRSGRFAEKLDADYGVVGTIRAEEIKFGHNGWHPHFHVLYILKERVTPEQLATMRSAISTRYIANLERNGYSAATDVGFDLRICVAAEYIGKLQNGDYSKADGAAWELASAHTKRNLWGSSKSLLPFDLGSIGYLTGDYAAIKLWQEYEVSTKGAQALVWSNGLKAKLYTLPEVPKEETEDMEEEETLYELRVPIWAYELLKVNGARHCILSQSYELCPTQEDAQELLDHTLRTLAAVVEDVKQAEPFPAYALSL